MRKRLLKQSADTRHKVLVLGYFPPLAGVHPFPQPRQERLFRSGWRMKVHLSAQQLESSFPGAVFFPGPPSPLLALPSEPNEDKCGGALVGRRWEEQREAITDGFRGELTDTDMYAPLVIAAHLRLTNSHQTRSITQQHHFLHTCRFFFSSQSSWVLQPHQCTGHQDTFTQTLHSCFLFGLSVDSVVSEGELAAKQQVPDTSAADHNLPAAAASAFLVLKCY